MADFLLPCGSELLAATHPNATLARLHPTPAATLPDSQQAIGAWLTSTLKSVRAARESRLPPKPDKKTGARAWLRVLIAVADDSRRVGYDPWIAELADTLIQAGLDAGRIDFFVLGQLDDPPLGLRLIRHLGEDSCGRFAVESHRADRENDHDPEQDGFDLSFLRDRTLVVAARPVFETPHWTNRLETFLGRGLLARPLADIVQTAAADEYSAHPTNQSTAADPLPALLAAEQRGYANLLAPYLDRILDAPFLVDHAGEPVPAHQPPPAPSAPAAPAATVVTAVGRTPSDLWFANLLTTAQAALPQLRPGGHLVVAGAADEGLPFPELSALLARLQTTPRENSLTAAQAFARELPDPCPALRYAILQLGTILQQAERLTFCSPGLLPEPDDDESERPRREIPAGPRLRATADLAALLAAVDGPVTVLQP